MPDGSRDKVDILGGFLGASLQPEDNALAPIISWAVVHKGA
jgi:hypothetical protein